MGREVQEANTWGKETQERSIPDLLADWQTASLNNVVQYPVELREAWQR